MSSLSSIEIDPMFRIEGNLITPKNPVIRSRVDGGVEVSWNWFATATEGTIAWIFRNASYKTKTFVLHRSG